MCFENLYIILLRSSVIHLVAISNTFIILIICIALYNDYSVSNKAPVNKINPIQEIEPTE